MRLRGCRIVRRPAHDRIEPVPCHDGLGRGRSRPVKIGPALPLLRQTLQLRPSAGRFRVERTVFDVTLEDREDFKLDEAAAYVNEIMSEDDTNDPLLESYQHYGKKA